MERSRVARMQLNVCADSMETLRRCDVYRLAELCINKSEAIHNEMIAWLESDRPDLVQEYKDRSDEILTERVYNLQHPNN